VTIAVAALVAVWVVAKGVDWLRGYPAWLQRAALGPEAPPFRGLAASQVGYDHSW
jgi:hypothetical protein